MKQRVVPSKRNVNTDKTSRAVVALSVLELAVLLLVLYRAFRSGGTLFEGGGDIAVTVLTLLVGVDDTKFDGAMAVIEKTCKSRKQIATSPSPVGGATGVHMPYPIEVMVGGATIFVLSVDQFIKL